MSLLLAARIDRFEEEMTLAALSTKCTTFGQKPVQKQRPQCAWSANWSDSWSLRYLKTSEAAGLLNVSPNTLRAWERRFGYPKPERSPGKHRLYTHGEIAALKDALQEGLSISSAISRAREGLSADADSLLAALLSFDQSRADLAIEAALALRSLDRSVEEVLLPSLADLHRRYGAESAHWEFGARWADDWLRRAQRLSPPPVRRLAILVGDAGGGHVDPDSAATRALELLCAREGAEMLTISVQATNDLADAVDAVGPDVVVVAGRKCADDAVARWAYAVRSIAGPLPVALFRRKVVRPLRARATGAYHLSARPSDARAELVDLITKQSTSETKAATPTPLVPRRNRAG
ncbi:MAG: MerR family transcriptional regulator [Actinobacteria bacterium]|nr:MAG: MerR family transcriptional regulator [Actinomycetota bacterium]